MDLFWICHTSCTINLQQIGVAEFGKLCLYTPTPAWWSSGIGRRTCDQLACGRVFDLCRPGRSCVRNDQRRYTTQTSLDRHCGLQTEPKCLVSMPTLRPSPRELTKNDGPSKLQDIEQAIYKSNVKSTQTIDAVCLSGLQFHVLQFHVRQFYFSPAISCLAI